MTWKISKDDELESISTNLYICTLSRKK